MANETKKHEVTAAFRLEVGKNIGSAWSFGGSTIQTLGANHAISYVNVDAKGVSESIEDNNIVGQAFMDNPVQTLKRADIPAWDGNVKSVNMGRLAYYWAGYEDGGSSAADAVFKFTVSGVTVSPTNGATYTNNSSTFTVREVSITAGAGTIWAERTTGSNDPLACPDTLTKASGTGDATLSYSVVTAAFYFHLFELDQHERGFCVYRTAEQTAGDFLAADRKNRFATVAFKRGPNDHRYSHIICTKFGFSSTAGQKLTWNCGQIGHAENRGDHSSGTWTFPTGADLTDNDFLHRELTVSIGPSGSLVAVGVTDITIDIAMAMNPDQDTESGLNIIEPVLDGFYVVTGSITLARHSADTFLANRDAHDLLALKIVADKGDFMFGLFIPSLKISDAAISGDTVANHTLTLEIGQPATNPFTSEIWGVNLIQNGPVFLIIRDQNAQNEMRRE